jgi:hypothetical protein
MKRLALVAALAALALTGVTSAQAAPTPLPAHVYAPYFETWTTDGLTTTAQQSGAKYLTLPFDNGGCPGVTGSNSCSGIVQNTWDFTHLLQPFTGP